MAQTIKLKRSGTEGNIPTTSQLELGEVAINTYDGKMFIKKNVGGTESIVEISAAAADAILVEYQFTSTASQTTYSGSDDNTETLSYTPNAIQVFMNGILLDPGIDFTATNGTSIVLSEAADANDYLQIFAFKKKISDGQVSVDTFTGDNSTVAFTLSVDPGDENNTRVFIDGVYQSKANYSVSGTTLTFSTAPPTDTAVEVEIGNRVVTLDTLSDLDLPDDVKLRLGTGQDLQIYHDGSTSWIQDSAADLRVETNGLTLRSISQENYITAAVNGAVTVYYDGSAKLATTNDGVTVTGDVEADEFIGDLRGAVLFKAQAGETLAKGEVVYISGISGNTTIVSKADADDASKMPAFGLVAAAASSGNPVDIYTNGILSGIDTSSYSEGDELFVSTTAGALTATPPTGESAALQKIGKVTRSNATSGSIFIVGAGRSNAVPNLDDGDIFIGNASNQAVTASLNTKIEDYLDAGTSTPTFAGLATTANMTFGDNDRVIFGTGSDLQIYHDGSNSYIGEFGTGSLRIRSNQIRLEAPDSQNMVIVTEDAGVQAFYDGTQRFQVTNTGIDVTGTVTADDSITLAATPTSLDENRLIFNETPAAGSLGSRILWRNPATGYDYASVGFTNEAGSSGGLRFKTASSVFSDSDALRMKIADNGDIQFYEDTGTTPKFHWDAADERLGLGTDSPQAKLHIDGDGTYASIRGYSQVLDLGNWTNGEVRIESTGAPFHLRAAGNQPLHLETNNVERVTVLGTGNVGIGTASPSQKLHVSGDILSTGKHYFVSANNYIEADQNTGTRLRFNLNGYKQAELIRVSGENGQFAVKQFSTGSTAAGYPAFTEMEDTNTGLFFPGDNQVGLTTNGTEALRIDSSGNVGIGVSNPSVKLAVAGGLSVTSNITNNSAGHAYLTLNSAGVYESGIIYQRNSTSKWETYIPSGNDNYRFYSYGDGTTQLEIRDGVDGNGGTILSGLGVDDSTDYYGNYGALILDSNQSYTSSSRSWMLTNALKANTFGILYSDTATTKPSLTTYGDAASGTSVALSITNTGNVGIGTDSPTSAYTPTLHISGANPNLRLDGTSGNSWAWITTNTATAGEGRAFGLAADGSFRITADPDSMDNDIQFLIRQNGNVGIGVTSPLQKFHLYDDGGYYASIQRGNSTPGGSEPWLGLFNDTNIADATYGWAFYDSNGDGSLQLWNKNNSTTGYDVMTFQRGGNVGIGTDSPSRQLEIFEAGRAGAYRFKIKGDTGYTGMEIENTSSNNTNILFRNPSYTQELYMDSNGKFHVYNNSLHRFTIDQSGNVGIGNDSPTSYGNTYRILHIGNASAQGLLKFGTGAAANGPEVYSAGTGRLYLNTDSTTNVLNLVNSNVGIGTTSPASTLHVDSSAGAVVRLTRLGTNSGAYGQLEHDGTLLTITSTGDTKFYNNAGESMRINADGDFIVSNTDPRVASNYSTQAGLGWDESDLHAEIATTLNRSVLELGRNNANSGDVITIRQQSVSVGMIGTEGGDSLVIQSNGATGSGLRFHPTRAAIEPVRQGATIDNVVDLGADSRRFKDLYLSGNAKIGLSTVFPGTTAALNVRSNTSALEQFAIRVNKDNYADTGGHTTLIGFGNEPAGWSKGAIGFQRVASYDVGDFLFCLNANAASGTDVSTSDEKMRIKYNGNVGIGTTTPQYKLDVVVDNNSWASFGRTLGVGAWAGVHFGYSETGNTNYRKSAIVFERTDLTEGNAQGKVHILNGPQSGGGSATLSDAKLTIREDGNVGIGDTNPESQLEVNEGSNYRGVHVRGSNTPSFTMAKGTTSTPEWRLGISGYDGNDFAISTGSTVNDQMRMDPDGNVMFALGTANVAPRTGMHNDVPTLQTRGPLISGSSQGTYTNSARNTRDWFVYAGPTTNTGVYVHMKTNLDVGTSSNSQFTMSSFTYHNYYAYGGSWARGQIGWHNWSGSFYNVTRHNEGTLELVQPSYVSSDGYAVLVAKIDAGYAQFSIDWFQWAGYTFREAKVTAVTQSSSATGAY